MLSSGPNERTATPCRAAEMGVHMITIPELVAQALSSFLTSDTKSRFGASDARLAEVLPFAARLTLECIGNSDALRSEERRVGKEC